MRFFHRQLTQVAIAIVAAVAQGPASLAGAQAHSAALKASIVGEKDAASVEAPSKEERGEIYSHLKRVLNEVELEHEIEIRLVRNLGTFIARPPCGGPDVFVLDVDPAMYEGPQAVR